MTGIKKVVDNLFVHRAYLISAALLLFAVAIVFQIIRIQYFQQAKWLEYQIRERVYNKNIPADRGSILAEDGSILATSLPFFRVALDAGVIDERNFKNLNDSLETLYTQLYKNFRNKNNENFSRSFFKERIQTAIKSQDRHIYIFPPRITLTFNELKRIKSFAILNQGRFKGGLIIEKINNKRFYPLNRLAKVTLGSLDEEANGVKGIEYSFNAALRGREGRALVQRVAGNIEVPISNMLEVEAVDGYDVKTTLDVRMQDLVTNALEKAMAQHKAKSGAAILMEVKTGHIKAIANSGEVLNYAVGVQAEPGSTFKIASVIAALEQNVIGPDDTVDIGNGKRSYFDRTMSDEKMRGKYTFRQVIEKSSNVGISSVIFDNFRKKPQVYIQELEKMGILSYTGFQLRGEPQPYITRPGDPLWSGVSLPALSIGYGVKLTPLQILTFFNAIANNGVMIQPIIVKEIRNNSGVFETFQTQTIRNQICSRKTLGVVQSLLKGVVQNGTARNIRGTHYTLAGKTGTTKQLIDGEYQKIYSSSFVGYFPAEAPQYSCIVIVNEPSSGEYYGADVAAPVFKEIADNIFSTVLEENYKTPPSDLLSEYYYPVNRIVNTQDARTVFQTLGLPAQNLHSEGNFALVNHRGRKIELKDFPIAGRITPSVKGMTARDAIALLENIGFRVLLKGRGKVVEQSIKPGHPIRKGEIIVLTLA